MNVSVTEPDLLLVGIAAVLLVLIGLALQTRRRRRLAVYLGPGAQHDALAALRGMRGGRTVLMATAAFLTAAGAAGPRADTPAPPPPPNLPPPRVVVAIDISASMQATDVQPTRLGRAVQIASDLLQSSPGGRVGLMVFGSKPYVLVPPTPDHSTVSFMLDGLEPEIASAQDPGSLLVGPLTEAELLLRSDSSSRGGIAVLITDGDTAEEEGRLMRSVERLVANGIRVHVVGVGTASGGTVNLPRNSFQLGGPVLDAAGQPAVSRLNESLLRRIAGAGRGAYASGGDRIALNRIAADLSATRALPEGDPATPARNLTFLATTGALLLLLIDGLVESAERWRARSALARAGS